VVEDSAHRFSERYGFSIPGQGQPIRDSAPESLRCGLLQVIHDKMEFGPKWIRQVVCGVLRVRPDSSNWSDYPNVWDEVQGLVHNCEWFRIYDVIEGIYAAMQHDREDEFERLVNSLFIEEGIGWQMVDGLLQIRGDEAFEQVLHDAAEQLNKSGLATSTSELHEAIRDLSRRPEPDLSGAIQHSMAGLECATREFCEDVKPTLGQLIKKYPGLFPKPVGDAVAKLWGYASEQARHGRESRELAWEEAQLVVGVAAALCSYLTSKNR